jgi:hypothetical protein
MASYLNFAGIIANLQGILHMDLDPAAPMTLTDLDQRLRRLEDSQNITPLPPLLEPTWDVLAWRLCRLSQSPSYRDPNHGPIIRVRELIPRVPFSSLIGVDDKAHDDLDLDTTIGQPVITLQKVSDIVYSIKYTTRPRPSRASSHPTTAPILKGPEDKDFAHTMQRLLHVAGDHGLAVKAVPTTVAQLYALAADIAIHIEAKQAGLGRPPPAPSPCGYPGTPGPIPPNWPLARPRPLGAHIVDAAPYKPRRGKKAARSISDISSVSGTTASSISDRRKGVLRRVFGFGWVKSLMCWRKERVFDDDDSSRIVD